MYSKSEEIDTVSDGLPHKDKAFIDSCTSTRLARFCVLYTE